MVHLFLCLALVCHAAQAQRCPLSTSELAHGSVFLTHLDSPARQGKLVNCTWYSESTCCTPEDTLRISHEPSEINLHGSPMRCLDAMRLLACSPCSSDQSLIFRPELIGGFDVPVLRVCESFCDAMYDACRPAELTLRGGAAERVEALFSSGAAFCSAVGLRVIRGGGAGGDANGNADDACFSSASRRAGGALSTAAMAALGGATLLSALGRRALRDRTGYSIARNPIGPVTAPGT